MKEHGALPCGPTEISSTWFALALLAFSVTKFRFWSKANAAGVAVDINVTVSADVRSV